MIKILKFNKLLYGVSIFLIISWIIYSVFFQQFYQEVEFFTTEGAQAIVQILQIVNYRGADLLPFLLLFFSLTALSFLFCIYCSIVARARNDDKNSVRILWGIYLLFILYNSVNKLGPLLVTLIIIAAIIMYSLVVTINYLYVEKTIYDAGDVIYTEGPFDTELEAQAYSQAIIEKRQKDFETDELVLECDIYSNESGEYHADLYLNSSVSDSEESI